MTYTRQKLRQALECLIAPGPIQGRLMRAGRLLMFVPDARWFPGHADLHERFKRMYARLTAADAATDEGKIVATTQAMTSPQCVEIAEEMFALFLKADELTHR